MSLTVHLLGRPHLERTAEEVYEFRGRKSWALLTYLLLSERPPSRSQLASLLFSEADDPLRALRWSLSEIRRGLDDDGTLEGDPVVLQLGPDASVDVDIVARGSSADAVALPGLGADLLEGMDIRGAAGFSAWLLCEQRHLAAASEAILHEAALRAKANGAFNMAIGFAARAASMSPLDENHQALLIRLYRLIGDDAAAKRQLVACTELFDRELGVEPGIAVQAAIREPRYQRRTAVDEASVDALVEAGVAAVSVGATDAGVQSLRMAVGLADDVGSTDHRLSARLALAEALIHSIGGLDEDGLATLHEAHDIALAEGRSDAVAQARSELGYVDFLRARYDRAEVWLIDAAMAAESSPAIMAKSTTYLGSVESDRSNYPGALGLLDQAVSFARVAGDHRREAFALSMLGRVNLLCGDLDQAADQLDAAMELAESDRWLAFLPWPQALRGEVQVKQGDGSGAEELLQHAFARACQLGDPCWEGTAARGLALVADTSGDPGRAFELLADARARCNRFVDPYVWLDVYILDAQCELGIRRSHPDSARWWRRCAIWHRGPRCESSPSGRSCTARRSGTPTTAMPQFSLLPASTIHRSS
ncbi:MAG: tetratricopeptide repeat protein [Acidimicrobiia bacterium]|nr:tetratricopeptide repeat protein [Acidimicrobiia bacterium]